MKRTIKATVKTTTISILVFLACSKLLADTNYVGKFGSPSGNYYTNIQSAVTAASGGDFVIVSNGTYILSSQIDVNTNLTIQSVNGPGNTIVDGNDSVRCFVLFDHSTVLSGFTITNGNAGSGGGHDGGGVYCCDTTPVITNSTIIGNTADTGGGTLRGTVSNCRISANSAVVSGGGTFDSAVNNSTIIGNTALFGGGSIHGTVNNSTFIGNSARKDGGGTSYSTVNNCIIIGNSADNEGGGVYCSSGGALTNCLIYGMNSAKLGGGVFCVSGGEVFNCTIAGNYASTYGGGICASNGGSIFNTIIYDNQSALSDNDNWMNYPPDAAFSYCCTTPTNNLPVGNNCISDDPMFVAPDSDYHLTEGSPCINIGLSMPWTFGATDLDGNPRRYDGDVDMGCYEFIPEPCLIVNCYLSFVIYYYCRRKFIPQCEVRSG